MVNLSKMDFGYKKRGLLFEEFSLSLTRGNIYGLLGKNGAGKTTLLKLISGLLYPQKGRCMYEEFPTMDRDPDILKEIYFLPENSYLPQISIKEYLELYAPFYPRFDETSFLRYMQELEIEKSGKITGLSYGQKKKFSIAFALAANTRVLLLDEPTNGLDIPAKSVFRKLVASSVSEEKMFVISTHQVRDMKHLIDPILILDNGKIVFNRQIAEIEQRISLDILRDKPEENEVLYYEHTLGGYAVLAENKNGSEDEIDIELLFNAVVAQDKKVLNLFNIEAAYENEN